MGNTLQIQTQWTEQPLESSGGLPRTIRLQQKQCQHSGPLMANTYFSQDDIFIGGHCHPQEKHPPVSSTKISFHDNAGLQTSKSFLSRRLTEGELSLLFFHFFCLLHLACAAFSSTYLPPVELSCSITAPITLLKLFLRLSLIFLSLIPIYFPKPHPWVKMGNIREEIKRLKSSLLQVKFLFFQRHEAGSRL